MGKIDQRQTKKRSCKATCKSKHNATDGESKHKKQQSLVTAACHDSTLGWWVGTQGNTYRLYQEGKRSGMTDERIRALNGIGFDWWTSKTDLVSI